MTTPILSRSELDGLVAHLASDGTRVIAPVPAGPSGDETEYHAIRRLDDAELGGTLPRRSLKEFFRPAPDERTAPAPQVILGARPCDAAGVERLGVVMGADYHDPLWRARREATTIVTFACPGADRSCFCSAVGAGPDSTRGADALLVPLDAAPGGPPAETRVAESMGRYVDVYLHDSEPYFGAADLQGSALAAVKAAEPPGRWLAQPITAKGEALLAGWGGRPAGAADLRSAEAFARAARERVARNLAAFHLPARAGRLDPELEARLGIAAADGGELVGARGTALGPLPEWLAGNFDHEAWRPLSRRCRSCGACSAVCSTSPCLDEVDGGQRGREPFRRRTEGLRNRVIHKFSVAPQRFDAFLCTGCGRCARRCEAGMCLPEVLGGLVQLAGGHGGTAR